MESEQTLPRAKCGKKTSPQSTAHGGESVRALEGEREEGGEGERERGREKEKKKTCKPSFQVSFSTKFKAKPTVTKI